MAAATTRLWVPNLWLPRTEFRLRRTRDAAADDRALVRVEAATAVESRILTTGGAGGPFDTPFMARPVTGPLNLNNQAQVAAVAASGAGTVGNPYVIRNRSFDTLGTNVIAIRLANVSNVLIRECDFRNVAEGIAAAFSSNIVIEWCRYKNITGPHARENLYRANFVQFDRVTGGAVRLCKGREGDTEDIISIYASRDVIVEDNHLQGTNWTSPAGSGIALGDQGGSGNIARRNTLMDVGQVGIFIAGGSNCKMMDNIIHKTIAKGGSGDVGMYVWNQATPGTCFGHTVSGNRVWWRHLNGNLNPFWNPNNCGSIVGLPPPEGPPGSTQTNNFADATLNPPPASLTVVL